MSLQTLWTIGHSNRELADFLDLLTENGIEAIADVRRFPGSRRYPQFGAESLAASLAGERPPRPLIAYHHFPALGGRRTNRDENSPNNAWRVAAFAAYADYMLTPEFAEAFDKLKSLVQQSRTCIMCAEALPWCCHRRLIADQFVSDGWQVLDIMGPHVTKPHELPAFATVVEGHVTYPA